MKPEYIVYGKRNVELDRNLQKHEKELLENFLAFCSMTASPGKVSDYRRYMLQFRDILEKPLDTVDKNEAIRFWALVNSSPHEEATKITIRSIVKRFLNWHYQNPELTKNLKNRQFKLNEEKINQSVLLKPEELEVMVRSAEKLRDKALLMLLYESAARPQEIRDLRWQHIDWQREEVQLYSKKKKKAREIPVKHAMLHLKRWRQEFCFPDVTDSDYIFPSRKGRAVDRSRPISDSYLASMVRRLAMRAGISRKIHPYLFRHSRLTEIHKLGIKGVDHNLFAGHVIGSKQQATYVHLNNEDMKRTVLDCVYNVKEVERKEQEYEKQIAALRGELDEIRRFLATFKGLATLAKERAEKSNRKSAQASV